MYINEYNNDKMMNEEYTFTLIKVQCMPTRNALTTGVLKTPTTMLTRLKIPVLPNIIITKASPIIIPPKAAAEMARHLYKWKTKYVLLIK